MVSGQRYVPDFLAHVKTVPVMPVEILCHWWLREIAATRASVRREVHLAIDEKTAGISHCAAEPPTIVRLVQDQNRPPLVFRVVHSLENLGSRRRGSSLGQQKSPMLTSTKH